MCRNARYRSRILQLCSRFLSARSIAGTGKVRDRRITKSGRASAIEGAMCCGGQRRISSRRLSAPVSVARATREGSSRRWRANRSPFPWAAPSLHWPRRFSNRCWQLDVPSTMLGFVRHLWWRHAVRDRRLQRRSAGTSSEAREERQERPGMHIEAQQRDDPLAQSESRLGDRSTNDQ